MRSATGERAPITTDLHFGACLALAGDVLQELGMRPTRQDTFVFGSRGHLLWVHLFGRFTPLRLVPVRVLMYVRDAGAQREIDVRGENAAGRPFGHRTVRRIDRGAAQIAGTARDRLLERLG